jgi:polysaccharide biosynthesis/export protein
MGKTILKYVSIFSLAILLNACASQEKIVYFQDTEGLTINDEILNYEPKIQAGDLLFINVSATEPEVAIPFNLYETPILGNYISSSKPITYLVNTDGEINFPILGKIKVKGQTTKALTTHFENILSDYIKDAVINIRLTNFKVSVIGEVNRPGAFTIDNERISIIEALSLAGDLTIYGNRKSVTLIRDYEGKKEFITIDLTNKELFNVPNYYYLKQNDVVYVSPNKTKVNSSKVGSNTGVVISSVSVIIALLAIIIK